MQSSSGSISNKEEASIISRILTSLLLRNIPENEIGVISLYKNQCDVIKELMGEKKFSVQVKMRIYFSNYKDFY